MSGSEKSKSATYPNQAARRADRCATASRSRAPSPGNHVQASPVCIISSPEYPSRSLGVCCQWWDRGVTIDRRRKRQISKHIRA